MNTIIIWPGDDYYSKPIIWTRLGNNFSTRLARLGCCLFFTWTFTVANIQYLLDRKLILKEESSKLCWLYIAIINTWIGLQTCITPNINLYMFVIIQNFSANYSIWTNIMLFRNAQRMSWNYCCDILFECVSVCEAFADYARNILNITT